MSEKEAMFIRVIRLWLMTELMLQGLCYTLVIRLSRGLAWWGGTITRRAQRAVMRGR